MQVIDLLERNQYTDMHRYMATDVTAAFGPGLLQSIGNPRMKFEARTLCSASCNAFEDVATQGSKHHRSEVPVRPAALPCAP